MDWNSHLVYCCVRAAALLPCCPAANVFSPEDGNEDVYNGSGCRDVVGAVLGGCNGEHDVTYCPFLYHESASQDYKQLLVLAC
jgi:hypothetical protein